MKKQGLNIFITKRPVLYLIALMICFYTRLISQNENSKWYFGFGAGLDFMTSPPTILTNTVMWSDEGCSSIADASGNLLFYTDGIVVWNRMHQLMDGIGNGLYLFGGASSTQAAMILKQPGSSNIYYIFTQDNNAYPNGLMYSIVDISLAAGMGSVTVRNVPIYTPSCEKLTATRHCNGKDIWVVTHEFNTNVFRSYLFTSAGINLIPVVSGLGTIHSVDQYSINAIGQMKISPDGSKLGLAITHLHTAEIFDFDNSTGIVSNFLSLGNVKNAYGCEFSPDGTKFYTAASLYLENIHPPPAITQWNLCAGSNSAILASSVTIISPAYALGSMQLAPNGKIYVARCDSTGKSFGEPWAADSLGVINNPNLAGTACNYADRGQPISPGLSGFGLPDLLVLAASSATIPFTYSVEIGICQSTVSFSAPSPSPANCFSTQAPIDYLWSFGEPESGPANTSTLANPVHTYTTDRGTYIVKLIRMERCRTDTIEMRVTTITDYPMVAPVTEFHYAEVCEGSVVTHSPLTAPGFNTGGTFFSNELNIEQGTGRIDLSSATSGTYLVNYSVAANGCTTEGSSTATVVVLSAPELEPGSEIKIAPCTSATLNVSGGTSYTWSPQDYLSCNNCEHPIASPPDDMRYCVSSQLNSCISCINVIVSCEVSGDYSVPNAFTPNGDGNNDTFCLQGWDLCTHSFLIRIFDRWGEKVFESSDPSFCWDGIYKGKELHPETFVYFIQAVFDHKQHIDKKGNIILIR